MKYAIMSDAHANPVALRNVFADARKQKCGKFVFLGDATGCRIAIMTLIGRIERR